MKKRELIIQIEKFLETKQIEFEINEIINECLEFIGDFDSYLRDDLIYTFLDIIIKEKLISDQDTIFILNQLVDNLDDFNKDSIYKRSFSLLGIASCINRHNQKPFLQDSTIIQIFKKILNYYISDLDVRGFDSENGWVHQAAHGADVLKEFALLTNLNNNMAFEILEAIKEKTSISYYGYIHGEDERMANVIDQIIKRKILNNDELINWFNSFSLGNEINDKKIVRKGNIRNLLRAIYFRIYNDDLAKDLFFIILKY